MLEVKDARPRHGRGGQGSAKEVKQRENRKRTNRKKERAKTEPLQGDAKIGKRRKTAARWQRKVGKETRRKNNDATLNESCPEAGGLDAGGHHDKVLNSALYKVF